MQIIVEERPYSPEMHIHGGYFCRSVHDNAKVKFDAGRVTFDSRAECQAICDMLNAAYAAGSKERARAMLMVLTIPVE
jgi:hypothetical protein